MLFCKNNVQLERLLLQASQFNFLIFKLLNSKSYDQHLNMILGEVEETVTSVEIDEETYEEVYKARFYFVVVVVVLNRILFLR